MNYENVYLSCFALLAACFCMLWLWQKQEAKYLSEKCKYLEQKVWPELSEL